MRTPSSPPHRLSAHPCTSRSLPLAAALRVQGDPGRPEARPGQDEGTVVIPLVVVRRKR